ncbi:MAG: M28 family peptidase [Deltaproteobacteria bacterium]|nr:M28 family peptidase [Deltaproteobacteria bacterium]
MVLSSSKHAIAPLDVARGGRLAGARLGTNGCLLALGLLVACSAGPGSAPTRSSRARPVATWPDVSRPDAPAPARLARRVQALSAAFDEDRAMRTVAFADQFFRVRGNRGYRKTLEHVETELRASGFPETEVRTLALGPVRDAWTPVRASLALVGAQGTPDEPLHAFADERGADRATLLVGSATTPTTELEVVLAENARPPLAGKVVLGRGDPAALHRTYVRGGGAAGILTLNLVAYHRPETHRDAAQFGYLRSDGAAAGFGFSISPRTDERLRAALARGPTRVRVSVEVTVGPSAATGVECTLRGTEADAPPVVLVAHVDEPGANDNASGVGALLELARALRASATGEHALRRSIVLLWGQENEVADAWLRMQPVPPMAGLVLDMVGQDPAVVRAPFLVERLPDPGAVWTRAPDEHTEWGSTTVDPSRIRGHYLSDHVMAAARLRAARETTPWAFRSHPFEGGSDHTSFLEAGIPAVLAWHFPDDAYHTTRDRLDRVSGAEMDRVASTMGAVAWTLAAARAEDVDELLAIVEHAGAERLASVSSHAREAIGRGADRGTERRIADAWVRFYEEALERVRELGPAGSASTDAAKVERARGRWRATVDPVLRAMLEAH